MSVPVATVVYPELKLIHVQADRSFKYGHIRGTVSQGELVVHAMNCFGFLLKSRAPQSYSLVEFADIIRAHYDDSNPQTRAVLQALLDVQLQTETPVVLH